MAAEYQKHRIALAVFETGEPLASTIEALLLEGVALERIGLIAAGAAALRLMAAGCSKALAALVADMTKLDSDHASIAASPCLLVPWHLGLRAPALWRNDAASEPSPRLAVDLEHHALRGAVILGVASSSPREQWSCARILLERSSSPVIALECSTPSPS